MLDDTARHMTHTDPFSNVRQRQRPGAVPAHWSNGSAVFSAGMAGRYRAWERPIEQQDGLLGRIERQLDGSYKVWRWTKGAYLFAGQEKDHAAALGSLGH